MRLALYIAVLAGTLPAAQPLTVCLRNPGVLPRETLISAEQTLWRVEKRLGASIRTTYGDCSSPRAVVVTFVAEPSPTHPADALGATRTSGSAVRPETLIFFKTAASILRNPSEHEHGVALGNIIAHELHHYLKQTIHHDGSELNCEFLTPRQLLATR